MHVQGKGSRGAKTEVDEAPKDPTVIKPLMGREGIEGTPFGHALAILADPFVVQLLCRTIARKLDEVRRTAFDSASLRPLFIV